MTRIEIEFKNIQCLKDYYWFLKKPIKVDLSFWGQRFVTIEGLDGSLPLASISRRVAVLAGNFSMMEGLWYGRRVVVKIDHLYEISNKQIDNCNFITLLFLFLRDYWNRDPFLDWEKGDPKRGDVGRDILYEFIGF